LQKALDGSPIQIFMKTTIFTFVLVLGSWIGLNAQAPFVYPLQVIPANPTTADTIYIITRVTTTEDGVYLGNDVYNLPNRKIRIEACYFNDAAESEVNEYIDTINLGTKQLGTWTVEYEAFLSGHDMVCNEHLDSNDVSTTFSILYLSTDEPGWPPTIRVYPNPVANGVLYIKLADPTEIVNVKVYNSLGELVHEGIPDPSGGFDVNDLHGLFYLQIYKEGSVYSRKIQIL
jgi:hypothetical protein